MLNWTSRLLGGIASQKPGGANLYPNALYAVDFQRQFFLADNMLHADHTTVAGYTAVGQQDISAAGLLCDGAGYGFLSAPAWPSGDWTFMVQANGLGVVNDRPLFSLRAAGAYDPEFFTYTYNSVLNINAKQVVASATAFEDFVVDSGPAPVRMAFTKNGSAVRVSTNGQAARALGNWSPFTPTRLHLGVRGDTDQFRFGGRITTYALYPAGMTDQQIRDLSTLIG